MFSEQFFTPISCILYFGVWIIGGGVGWSFILMVAYLAENNGLLKLGRKGKRRLIIWGGIFCLFIVLFLFRYPIMRGMGNYLIREDPLEQSDAIFVLSGNSLDRGVEGAKLFKQGYAPVVVCTGGVASRDLKIYGYDVLHSFLTQKVLVNEGVAKESIRIIPEGTSTHEEKLAIIEYCKVHQWNKIIVVSSKFHTRRIHNSFRKSLENEGIQLVLRGASESSFDEAEWWKYEDGLIFLNNEYVKIFYYFFKY